MKILFFGKLRDAFGSELEVPLADSLSVADLRHRLIADFPEGGEALLDQRVRAYVGASLVSDIHKVAAGDEIGFLSPVSGG